MQIVKLEAPELQGLEKSKAEQIKTTFEPMAKMLSEFEDRYNEVVLESEMEQELTEIEKFCQNNSNLDDSILIEELKKKAIIQERIIQNQKSQIETLTELKNTYFNQYMKSGILIAALKTDNKDLQKMINERCGHDEFLESKPIGNEPI